MLEKSQLPLTVGVLVTNYNSWDLALACIKATLELCGTRLDKIMLLDDCSPTAPPSISDERFELVRNETNLGFARTLNKGVTLLGTDLVIHFDADARPLTDFLEIVAATFSLDPLLAVLGFRAVDENNNPMPSHDKEPNAWSLLLGQQFYARHQAFLERGERRVCAWMCGIAIRRTTFEELGGFDEQFDLLDLDLEFGMRVNRSRWKTKIDTNLVIFHTGGGTPMLVSHRLLRFYRNRWLLLRKHHKITYPKFARSIILARLKLEYWLLRISGTFLFPNAEVRQDKLSGRKRLIRHCQENYL